jgi:tetratricopeptide (TPR) repeat protein
MAVAVFCCALSVRGLYLYDSRDSPTFLAPVVDSLSYDLAARTLVETGRMTRDFFWQQFFYPFFLPAVYLFSNGSILAAKILQILLGSAVGEFEKAVEKFRAALRLGPNDAEIFYNFGLCLQQQGRSQQAIEAYQNTLRINPQHVRASQALRELLRSEP